MQLSIIELAEARFEKLHVLGEGAFGKVYIARSGSQKYALKEVIKPAAQTTPLREEATILMMFDDRNVIKCFGVIEKTDPRSCQLFLEFAPLGDLRTVVERHNRVEHATTRLFFEQISSALLAIHYECICHRDIKPSNILVFSTDLVKVGDFGLATKMDALNRVMAAGTHEYQPPEAAGQFLNAINLDLWGAAMVFLFSLLGAKPWEEASLVKSSSYCAFQRGDLNALIAADWRWTRVGAEFEDLRRLLRHKGKRDKPPGYKLRQRSLYP